MENPTKMDEWMMTRGMKQQHPVQCNLLATSIFDGFDTRNLFAKHHRVQTPDLYLSTTDQHCDRWVTVGHILVSVFFRQRSFAVMQFPAV